MPSPPTTTSRSTSRTRAGGSGGEAAAPLLARGIALLDAGIVILDRRHRARWANRAAARLLGSNPAGADFRRFVRDILSPAATDGRRYARSVLAAYRAGTRIGGLRLELPRGPGRRARILRHRSVPFGRGAAAGRIEQFTDVTAGEEARRARRFSGERYRVLAERANEGLSYSDEEGIIRYANRGLRDMLGYRRGGLIGRSVAEFLDETGQEVHARQMRRRARGEPSRYELRLRSARGEMVPMRVAAVPVFDEAGRFRGGYAVFTDLRERERVERMREEIHRESSHRLKTPAAKIGMGLNLLKRHVGPGGPAEARLGLDMIETELDRMRRNTDSLLELSLIEAGGAAARRERFDLAALLDDLAARFLPAARRKGIRIEVSTPGGRLPVDADRDRLDLLLRNVLDNAVAFSRRGTIAVTAARRGGGTSVSVRDEGRGIEPAYLERMFDRNFQRYPGEPGAGIGLAACRAIASLHGGRIRAESEGKGRGVTIRLWLPDAGMRSRRRKK
ncbi:MAG: PAS domain-containing sensor histidine kinase [bacterium]|nr:PAS domain-containing sensor histidine kinase [bacterium]